MATKQIGADTLQAKTESVEAILHHLCFDVGVKPHEQTEAAPPPAGITEPTPPPPAPRQVMDQPG